MKDPVEIRMLMPGNNWMTVGARVSVAMSTYYSKLPKGSTVSVKTGDPGDWCLDAPIEVAEGRADIAISTPNWYPAHVFRSRGERVPLRAIGAFDHDDLMLFAVKAETGLKSLHEIRERKYPLRVSAPAPGRHPATWMAELVMREYGFTFDDLKEWGGGLVGGRPKNPADPNEEPVSVDFDAIFDEAITTPRWTNATDRYDLDILPIDEDILRKLAQEGIPSRTLTKGRFRRHEQDLPQIDYQGWLMFCHEDLDDLIAYEVARAVDDQKAVISSLLGPSTGLSSPVDMKSFAAAPDMPLHPGAEAYYREKGYL